MAGPILFASDLDPRSDRAADRALALAGPMGTSVVALHVAPPPEHDAALARLERDMGGDAEYCIVRAGGVPETIASVACEIGARLVVLGASRDGWLRKLVFGGTVERLLSQAVTPLLMVRERVHGPYRNLLVASEFEDATLLRNAERLFPDAWFTIVNARDVPPGDPANSRAAEGLERIAAQAGARLDAILPANLRTRVRTLVLEGDPAAVAAEQAQQLEADLTVVGSSGKPLLASIATGSVARDIVEAVDGDILFLPR